MEFTRKWEKARNWASPSRQLKRFNIGGSCIILTPDRITFLLHLQKNFHVNHILVCGQLWELLSFPSGYLVSPPGLENLLNQVKRP